MMIELVEVVQQRRHWVHINIPEIIVCESVSVSHLVNEFSERTLQTGTLLAMLLLLSRSILSRRCFHCNHCNTLGLLASVGELQLVFSIQPNIAPS